MFEQARPYALLAGRGLLGLIFLLSGVMKLMNWSATAEQMADKGMPAVPVLLALAILTEIGAGLGVILGCQARVSALVLFAFLIPTTLIFHNFWAYEGRAMQEQMANFLKNLSIMGGLLTLAAAGAGRYSLDAMWPWGTWSMRSRREELAESLSH